MSGPLSGVRVIDLTVNVLGPLCTQVLGDMGADVIKIETPQGDPMRQVGPSRNPGMGAFYLNINRNKRSVVLDLKRPAAREALLRLIDGADVFIHSMRQSAAERLGIGHEAVTARNPRIIYATGNGYSQSGGKRDLPAFDDVIQGESGLAAINGRLTGEPRYVPMPLVDKLVGLVLASSVGMALYRRERTGKGDVITAPMLETMLSFNLVEHLWSGVLGEPEKGMGYPRMFTPHRRPYRTRDSYICVLAHTDEHWRKLFAAIGRPEMVADERFTSLFTRMNNVDALYGVVAEGLTERATAEWRALLDAADVPNAPVNDFEDLIDDPYLRETNFFQAVDHPTEGKVVTTAIPVSFANSPGSLRRHPPNLGEHTDDVLAELGFSAEEAAAISGMTEKEMEKNSR